MNTLYSTQKRAWSKYEELWAHFEQDHLKREAPIPSSAQFLLVHLLEKARKNVLARKIGQRRASPEYNNSKTPEKNVLGAIGTFVNKLQHKSSTTPASKD